MDAPTTRRRFLHTTAASGTLLGLTGLRFLTSLPPVLAEDLKPADDGAASSGGVDPLVRLLEETPRGRLLEAVADTIHKGATYREWLAALLLAGVRNVQPRPSVGFKFHAVLVVNSVHLAAMASPAEDRWLPLFWALDYFKDSQARDEREGDWTLGPPRESELPEADRAAIVFVDAMQRWDESKADAAVTALARTADEATVFELFYGLGARDFRSIGHKAIYVAQARRALQFIGWRHAEPVLRSLAYALLMHEDGNPAERDAEADRPWRRNAEIVEQIQADPKAGRIDAAATRDLLAVFREGSFNDAADAVVRQWNAGIAAQSIWDAVFCGSGELLLRQPGIVALHSATTTNALHYAFQHTRNPLLQKRLLLQNAAFLPMFREAMRGRGRMGDPSIEGLEPTEASADPPEGTRAIFAQIPGSRTAAAQKTLGYLQAGGAAGPLLSAARHWLLLKGNDAHDYKFGSAVLEDFTAVSPAWRNRFLAACMMHLCGAEERDSGLVDRTREVLRS